MTSFMNIDEKSDLFSVEVAPAVLGIGQRVVGVAVPPKPPNIFAVPPLGPNSTDCSGSDNVAVTPIPLPNIGGCCCVNGNVAATASS